VTYRSPGWLIGGHLQTIVPATLVPKPVVAYQRLRWDTPDGDFLDLDWVTPQGTPRATVVMFHGLEGSSHSHYALALMQHVLAQGMQGVVVHFRGCSGEANRAPRFYHSGDSAEMDWVLRRICEHCAAGPVFVVGVSLGGNVLLKWAAEQGQAATSLVRAACAISAPLDLAASGATLGRGFNLVYTRMFLKSLKAKSIAKLAVFPGLYDRNAVLASNNLYEFDNVVTAPLHGFANTEDYWRRASSKPLLRAIELDMLVINALNDPFLPAAALPGRSDVSHSVTLEYPTHGGHVGFLAPVGAALGWLPQRVTQFFAQGL
jgi:uncharacterized protein